jgi:hypothetical protein
MDSLALTRNGEGEEEGTYLILMATHYVVFRVSKRILLYLELEKFCSYNDRSVALVKIK